MARSINFGTFAKAKELQQRILFTLFILVIYRFGTYIPVPGIDPEQFAQLFERQAGGILANMNAFAGGAIEANPASGNPSIRSARTWLPSRPSFAASKRVGV